MLVMINPPQYYYLSELNNLIDSNLDEVKLAIFKKSII